jgi:phage terminase Nu1 subunit (DNA packaging protein)
MATTRSKAKRAKRRRKPGKSGDQMTRRDLAAALGVHMQTITKREREGMPVAKRGARGRPSLYSELAVRAWLQQRDEAARQSGTTDLNADRARKERAQAALAEQAYAIRMRDLLPREEVEKAWHEEVAAVRTLLLAWPSTIADQVYRAALTERLPGVERALSDAVRAVLRELADATRPVPSVAVAEMTAAADPPSTTT